MIRANRSVAASAPSAAWDVRPGARQCPRFGALTHTREPSDDFGSLWRDPAVPGELREEAAREIVERLHLWGLNLVAVHPRAEHAWLLGMAAKGSE